MVAGREVKRERIVGDWVEGGGKDKVENDGVELMEGAEEWEEMGN